MGRWYIDGLTDRSLMDYSTFTILVSSSKDSLAKNGMKKSLEDHELKLKNTDEKLNVCLASLKKSAAEALRKSRGSTNT